MRRTAVLLRQCLRMTLFTRENCSLCTDAKAVISKVWDRRPFEFDEIDVMAPGQAKWKALYEFDTPVIHMERAEEGDLAFSTSEAAKKLMHRFREDQIEAMMDGVMDGNDALRP